MDNEPMALRPLGYVAMGDWLGRTKAVHLAL